MTYSYIKTINNNAITAVDENNKEVIIMGKGIGVKCIRIPGAKIDKRLIERVFVSDTNRQYIEAITNQIPYAIFELVESVIKKAETDLNTTFKDAIYLTLVDHIYFSYKVVNDGGKIENPLLNEIKMFHPQEFIAAMNSIALINNELHASFDEHEASYIAFHYISALSNLSNLENKQIMRNLDKTMEYIDELTNNSLNKNSYQYGRLMIHLKCLFNRLISNERLEDSDDFIQEMAHSLKDKHRSGWDYAANIAAFIKDDLHLSISDNEVAYLTMHIVPMLKRND